MNTKHAFCRELEKDLRREIGLNPKQWHTHKTRVAARFLFSVYGPDKFYWYGQSCCAWAARADAYDAFDRHQRIEKEAS